jgi:sepiapterin reductase
MVLLSRDAAGMAGTADAVRAAHANACITASTMDVTDLDGLEPAWHAALAAAAAAAPGGGGGRTSCPAFDTALLVHNAGSLGEVARIRDLTSLAGLRAAVDANVTSTVWLTALFLRLVRGPLGPHAAGPSSAGWDGGAPPPPSVVLNVSSLAAVQAFPTNGVYSAVKAARDMVHAVVAAEEAGDGAPGSPPPVRTLSYAPGPMDTAMQAELRASTALHPPTLALFQRLKAEGGLVDVRESAEKCARILRANRFVSGSHVDFYDAEP